MSKKYVSLALNSADSLMIVQYIADGKITQKEYEEYIHTTFNMFNYLDSKLLVSVLSIKNFNKRKLSIEDQKLVSLITNPIIFNYMRDSENLYECRIVVEHLPKTCKVNSLLKLASYDTVYNSDVLNTVKLDKYVVIEELTNAIVFKVSAGIVTIKEPNEDYLEGLLKYMRKSFMYSLEGELWDDFLHILYNNKKTIKEKLLLKLEATGA